MLLFCLLLSCDPGLLLFLMFDPINCVSLLSQGCTFCPPLSLRTGPSPGPAHGQARSQKRMALNPCMERTPPAKHARSARLSKIHAHVRRHCAHPLPTPHRSCPHPPASGLLVTRFVVLLTRVFEGSETEALGQGKLYSFQECGGCKASGCGLWLREAVL